MSKILQNEVRDLEEYRDQVQEQINEAIATGNEALRDLQDEVESLEREKARLIKQLISVRQDIELAKKRR